MCLLPEGLPKLMFTCKRGRVAELPDGVEVVAYCRGRYCVFAHDAIRLLIARGRTARRLADGMLEWRLAGLPVAV